MDHLDHYTAAFLLILAAVVVTNVWPWVYNTYVFPVLERRRLATEYEAGTRTDPEELEARRQRTLAEAASLAAAAALEEADRKAAKKSAESAARLRALNNGQTSYWATETPEVDVGRARDKLSLDARRAAALERVAAATRAATEPELARRRAVADAQQAAWDAEEAEKEAARVARVHGDAAGKAPSGGETSAASTSSDDDNDAVAAAAGGGRNPNDNSGGIGAPQLRSRKRVLAEDELAEARRSVAALRLTAEPPVAAPASSSSAAGGDAITTLVIESTDHRGSARLTRRFRSSDSLRAVMDAVQLGLPGGMAGRQLETRQPRRVVAAWRDYDLRDLKFDTELERARARAEEERGGSGGGGGAVGKEAQTLAEAGLTGRCALLLRPMEPLTPGLW